MSHSNLHTAKDYMIANLIKHLKLYKQVTLCYLISACQRKDSNPKAKPIVLQNSHAIELELDIKVSLQPQAQETTNLLKNVIIECASAIKEQETN